MATKDTTPEADTTEAPKAQPAKSWFYSPEFGVSVEAKDSAEAAKLAEKQAK